MNNSKLNNNRGILDPEGKNLNPLNDKPYSEKYKSLAEVWSKFPAYNNPKDIIKKIDENQVILVVSGTGSGKTVLIPKYALHQTNYKGHIMVSLPKQIIAQSAAEFASLTLDVNLGEQVGYKYKGSDTKYAGKNPNLLYATDGTIVAKALSDPLLKDIDIVVIDEAHERKVQIDFMMYLLRNVIKERKDFKLIIMSATVNSEIFAKYFEIYKFVQIDIGTKTNYEIKSIFSDKSVSPNEYINNGLEIINKLISKKESGKISDILFFVTSVSETQDVCKKLRVKYPNIECIEVYSGMNQEKQEMLSKKITTNQRIIVSTNVAESSLTIDGIKYVIDSGYELLSYYNTEKRGRVLEKGLITQAQAKQRMGRAGRTAPGICYHLYTRDDFDNNMKKFPEPSIRVSNITNETLRLLNIESIESVDNVKKVFSELIEPPSEKYINLAIKTLFDLDLISDNKINKLGRYVCNTQLEPEQALSVLMGFKLNCSKEVIAILLLIDLIKNNLNELFILPTDIIKSDLDTKSAQIQSLTIKFKQQKNKLGHKYGDHLTLIKIFSKFRSYKTIEKQKEWCYDYFLKYNILQKCSDMYNRIKYRLIDITKRFISNGEEYIKDADINPIKDMHIDYKILYSLKFGYRLNVGYFSANKNTYRTMFADRVNISKDSIIYNTDKNIFYHELFITKSSYDLNIVSIIPSKINL
jgi:HrpA-like RNA helicase